MKKIGWILLLFLTACASGNQTGGSLQAASQTYSVSSPEQWRRLDTNKYLIFTREGAFQQYILIQQRPVDRPFKHTKRLFDREMLPQEAAAVIIDEIISDRAVLHFKVIENAPTVVNSYDGFKMVFTYRNEEGLTFKTIYYGFLRGEWFYSLRYNAAQDHYSEKDVHAFEKVVESFHIDESQSASVHGPASAGS